MDINYKYPTHYSFDIKKATKKYCNAYILVILESTVKYTIVNTTNPNLKSLLFMIQCKPIYLFLCRKISVGVTCF